MKGQKIEVGMQIGDLTCVGFVGYIDKTKVFRWRCACGKEMDLRTAYVSRFSECRHNEPPKVKRERYTPSHVEPYSIPEDSPCMECKCKDTERCSRYDTCLQWRAWFSGKWSAIRKEYGVE